MHTRANAFQIIGLIRCCRHETPSARSTATVVVNVLSEFIDPDVWKVSLSDLTLVRELGRGAFGIVNQMRLREDLCTTSSATVAVKQLKGRSSQTQLEEFCREMDLLKQAFLG